MKRETKPGASAPPPALFVRATSPGTGGIATFILDGWGLAAKLQPHLRAKRELRLSESGDLVFARFVDGQGRLIDEVIAAFLGSNETATGYEQLELSCHGGIGSAAAVEAVLERAGFERASPADLLFRAQINNKLPLTAVEARLRLANAVTARQAEFLLGHGVFQKRWERFGFDAAMGMRSGEFSWRDKALQSARETLARSAAALNLLKSHSAVLVGPVNAGKSTLANRLAHADKHIVSAMPGTTRDRLDTPIAVRGLPLTLSDTAGLRESGDEVEREGQRRANGALESSDLRLIVLDGSCAPSEADFELIARCKALGLSLLVLNKADLGRNEAAEGLGFLAGVEPIALCAQSGTGVEKLEVAIESALLNGVDPQPGDAFTQRQIDLLREIQDAIENGFEDTLIIRSIIKLSGTRANAQQLQAVKNELP